MGNKYKLRQTSGDRTWRMNQKREYVYIEYDAAEVNEIINHAFEKPRVPSQEVAG